MSLKLLEYSFHLKDSFTRVCFSFWLSYHLFLGQSMNALYTYVLAWSFIYVYNLWSLYRHILCVHDSELVSIYIRGFLCLTWPNLTLLRKVNDITLSSIVSSVQLLAKFTTPVYQIILFLLLPLAVCSILSWQCQSFVLHCLLLQPLLGVCALLCSGARRTLAR